MFGQGKLFGPFGSPRSIVGLGGLTIQIAGMAFFVRLAVDESRLFWWAVVAWLAPLVMWLLWLHANRVRQGR